MNSNSSGQTVAVIGCGYWGKNLVRNFHELGAVGAISDSDVEVAAAISKQYDVPAHSVESVLNNDSINGVVIAAPAELHFELAQQALSAGKHVFVEKPLALKVSEAEELTRLGEAADRVLMVGHLLQYHPAFLELKSIVNKGDLGRIQYVYSNRLNFGKVRREENILWSFAPHDISMILSIFGEEPDRVSALGASYLHKTVADVTTTHLVFPSGGNAHVFVSWLHPFKEQKLVVVGEKGMAVFDDGEPWNNKITLYPHKIEWKDGKPQPNKSDAIPVALEEAEPLKLECQHFLDCIANGERPRTDGREAIRVLRVLEAAEISMVEGRSASLRPKTVVEIPTASNNGAFVHESAFVDQPSEIGAGSKVWHFSHILSGSKIGKNCVIGQNVMVGPDVTLGHGCKIQNNVSLYKGVTLEDDVFCGPSSVFTNVNNPRANVERKDEFRPTLVRTGSTIGANATIVCGVTIGEFAFIAAGAVVTSDVPSHALMAGVPARRIGWMSHAGERLKADLICPRERRRYNEISSDCLEEILP